MCRFFSVVLLRMTDRMCAGEKGFDPLFHGGQLWLRCTFVGLAEEIFALDFVF